MSIKGIKISQIGIVVRDIAKAKEKWAKLIGNEFYRDGNQPDWDKVPTFTNGIKQDTSGVKLSKIRIDEDVDIALFEPCDSPSPYKDYLDKYGEGVMYLQIKVDDRNTVYADLGTFCEAKGPYHIGFYPKAIYSFVDTRDELGLQLNIEKAGGDNTELIDTILSGMVNPLQVKDC